MLNEKMAGKWGGVGNEVEKEEEAEVERIDDVVVYQIDNSLMSNESTSLSWSCPVHVFASMLTTYLIEALTKSAKTIVQDQQQLHAMIDEVLSFNIHPPSSYTLQISILSTHLPSTKSSPPSSSQRQSSH